MDTCITGYGVMHITHNADGGEIPLILLNCVK